MSTMMLRATNTRKRRRAAGQKRIKEAWELTNVFEASMTTQKRRRSRKKPRVDYGKACCVCKRDHKACNGQRPCQRCVEGNMQDHCKDGPKKKFGRPKRDESASPKSKWNLVTQAPVPMSKGDNLLLDFSPPSTDRHDGRKKDAALEGPVGDAEPDYLACVRTVLSERGTTTNANDNPKREPSPSLYLSPSRPSTPEPICLLTPKTEPLTSVGCSSRVPLNDSVCARRCSDRDAVVDFNGLVGSVLSDMQRLLDSANRHCMQREPPFWAPGYPDSFINPEIPTFCCENEEEEEQKPQQCWGFAQPPSVEQSEELYLVFDDYLM